MRVMLTALALTLALSARAPVASAHTAIQFASPTINGTISPGEYGTHIDGYNQQSNAGGTGQIWYMTWDNTNLYVAIANANVSEAAVLYIDAANFNPETGGTNATGSTTGFNYDNTDFAALPFRATFVAYVKDGYREYRRADGNGGWSSATASFGSYASGSGNTREMSIPWSAITGGGRPASFAWFGYLASSGGYVYGQVPFGNGNNGGTIGTAATYPQYYIVRDTSDGASGPSAEPFGAPVISNAAPGSAGSHGAVSHVDMGRKDCLGTARNTTSKVWFTVANGVLSAVLYPTTDNANVQTLQYIVTDGSSFTDLQTRDMTYTVQPLDARALDCRVVSYAKSGKYRITTDYFTDPGANTLVMTTTFTPLTGSLSDYRLYARYNPSINGNGAAGPPTAAPTVRRSTPRPATMC